MDEYKKYLPSMSSSFFDLKAWSILTFIVVYISIVSSNNIPSFFGFWTVRALLLIFLFALLCYDVTIGSLFAVATVISIVYSEIHKSKLIESYINESVEQVDDEYKDDMVDNFIGYTPLEEESSYSSSLPIFEEPSMNPSIPLKTASNDFLVTKQS
jgi:hypothetical protein